MPFPQLSSKQFHTMQQEGKVSILIPQKSINTFLINLVRKVNVERTDGIPRKIK